MLVKDLVESKELMVEEMGKDIAVVYERFENVNCYYKGEYVEEIECDPEEVVRILEGSREESLTNLKTYYVGKEFTSVEEIENDIRKNYGYLLK